MPPLSTEDIAELKAHHLACSHLIKGCQDAVIRLRAGETARTTEADLAEEVTYRAVSILEHILDSWCETASILRASLNQPNDALQSLWQPPTIEPNSFTHAPEPLSGRSGV
jgi:hypothetical protein